MRLPYLLLNRVDGPKETPAETARRRAKALSEQLKRARFEEALREELATMTSLREAMATQEPKRRWRFAAE